jgi:hypothetical protein
MLSCHVLASLIRLCLGGSHIVSLLSTFYIAACSQNRNLEQRPIYMGDVIPRGQSQSGKAFLFMCRNIRRLSQVFRWAPACRASPLLPLLSLDSPPHRAGCCDHRWWEETRFIFHYLVWRVLWQMENYVLTIHPPTPSPSVCESLKTTV